MINIITLSDIGTSHDLNQRVDGPQKVVDNLIKGLQIIGVEYSINRFNYEYTLALSAPAGHMVPEELKNNAFIGPTVWAFNNGFNGNGFKKVIAPSQWVYDLFVRDTCINQKDILIWPVGIDTEVFSPLPDAKKEFDCLIYFKNRKDFELELVKKILEKRKQSFKVLPYGGYKQVDFMNFSRSCKYCFIINDSESQGIGYQEILSMGLPMFIWDTVVWTYLGPEHFIHCTSAPYWSDECGLKACSQKEVEDKFDYFLDNIDNYNPRGYIVNNLSLELRTNEILNAFKNI